MKTLTWLLVKLVLIGALTLVMWLTNPQDPIVFPGEACLEELTVHGC